MILGFFCITRITILFEEIDASIAANDLGRPNVKTISVLGKTTPSRIEIKGKVFIVGFLFGQAISNVKYEKIKGANENFRLELIDFELQSSLIEEYPCNVYFIYDLARIK